jgi:ElaB/YqjD/DUF883 family membrane-anchored ribosome-binding protein
MQDTSQYTAKVTQDLKVLIRDSEELLAATAENAGERLQDVRARLSKALENARGTAQNLEAAALEKAKAADKVIRDHPYQSIGVAFGVGVLIGLVIGRSR